jgi:hypothetical protein
VPPAIEEEQVVDSGRAVTGAVLMAAGFRRGHRGIALNPTHAERARAQTARYVFVPGQDDRESVVRLGAAHNEGLRTSCARGKTARKGEGRDGADDEARRTTTAPTPSRGPATTGSTAARDEP